MLPWPSPAPVHPHSFHAGVHSVLVALLAEKADIQYDSELTDPNQLVEEIRALGFGASLLLDSEGYQQGKLDLTVSPVILKTWSVVMITANYIIVYGYRIQISPFPAYTIYFSF